VYSGNSVRQPTSPIFRDQKVQEECQEHLGMQFIQGKLWAVIDSQ